MKYKTFFLATTLMGIFSLQGRVLLFSQNTWTQINNFPGTQRSGAAAFSIGNKGYISTGMIQSSPTVIITNDLWEWNQATGVWTQRASIPAAARYLAVGFSIGAKGYVGTGDDAAGTSYKDFWEWDQATNVWTQKADFGGTTRYGCVGFSIGANGYIGTGYDGTNKQDFWQYNPAADTVLGNPWTQKAPFGGTARLYAVGFSIGSKGYIGTGNDGANKQDFWEYNPAADTVLGNPWTQKAPFGGTARQYAAGFSIGAKGYIGTGHDGAYKQDFWEWDQVADIWVPRANFPPGTRVFSSGFSIGTKGYMGLGSNVVNYFDFWEYSNCTVVAAAASTPSVICNGSSATITASGGVTYLWSTGATTSSIIVSPAATTSYSVTASDGSCISDTAFATITVNPTYSINDSPVSICNGDSALIYGTYKTIIGTYYDSLTTANGCDSIHSTVLTNNPTYSITDPAVAMCPGDSALIYGTYKTTAGTYYDSSTTINGCDSVHSTVLTVNPTYNITDPVVTICANDSASIYGNFQSLAGTYYDSLTTGNGCDSIHSTVLTVNPAPTVTLNLASIDTQCVTVSSVPLTGGNPSGGTYSGTAVSGGNFSPSTAGVGNYTITYTYSDGNGCTNTATGIIHVDACTGIASVIGGESLVIYPNPTSGVFTITTQQLPIKNIQVYNVLGEKVYESVVSGKSSVVQTTNNGQLSTNINLSSQPDGIYFVRANTEQGVVSKKVVVMK